MRVYAQNEDGSRELLFEVDDDAVERRQQEEQSGRDRQVLLDRGFKPEVIDQMPPAEFAMTVDFARTGVWTGKVKVMKGLPMLDEPKWMPPILKDVIQALNRTRRRPDLPSPKTTNPFGTGAGEAPDPTVQVERVNGNAICDVCGKAFRHHLDDEVNLDWRGLPYLKIGCEGERLKL